MREMYNEEPFRFLTAEEEHCNLTDYFPQSQIFLYSFDNSLVESLLATLRLNPLVAASLEIGSEFDSELDLDDLEDVKIVLPLEEFHRLSTFTSSQAGLTCTVCQEESQQGIRDSYTRLRCQHYFHTRCIQKWLTTQSSRCPECRRDQRANASGY